MEIEKTEDLVNELSFISNAGLVQHVVMANEDICDELLELSEAANKWYNREEQYKKEKDDSTFLGLVIDKDLEGLKEYKEKLNAQVKLVDLNTRSQLRESYNRVDKFIELIEMAECWERQENAYAVYKPDYVEECIEKARKWDEYQNEGDQAAILKEEEYEEELMRSDFKEYLKNQEIAHLSNELEQTKDALFKVIKKL